MAKASEEADVIMIVVPDHTQKKIYDESILPYMTPGKMLMFAHGFNIHFGQIAPPPGVDVTMIAPKSPGHRVRELSRKASACRRWSPSSRTPPEKHFIGRSLMPRASAAPRPA